MRPNIAAYNRTSLKSTNRMFDAAAAPGDLIYFAQADHPVVSGSEEFSGDPEFLEERLRSYLDTMAQPHVTGRDLIEAGIEPGEQMGELLDYAHKLRLAGIDRESAMKQVLAQARKSREKESRRQKTAGKDS